MTPHEEGYSTYYDGYSIDEVRFATQPEYRNGYIEAAREFEELVKSKKEG